MLADTRKDEAVAGVTIWSHPPPLKNVMGRMLTYIRNNETVGGVRSLDAFLGTLRNSASAQSRWLTIWFFRLQSKSIIGKTDRLY